MNRSSNESALRGTPRGAELVFYTGRAGRSVSHF